MADSAETPKKGLNIKALGIGIVLYIVQLVAMYFILANVILKRVTEDASKNAAKHSKKGDTEQVDSTNAEKNEGGPAAEAPKIVASIEDIIVNPAGSKGQRLVLVSVGFGLPSEKEKKELEEKKGMFQDVIINTLSSKTLEELSQVGYKDTLKIELTKKLKKMNPEFKFSSIYFGKFIIQ